MATDFEKRMPTLSDGELQEYITERSKYRREAVEAAIAEMQKRGRTFSEEELSSYEQEFQQRAVTAKNEDGFWSLNYWSGNIVEDENAPAFYTSKAIAVFSALFGVLFGSVLMAINIKSAGRQQGRLEVIGFGVLYTVLQFWFFSSVLSTNNTGLTIAFNYAGAFIIMQFFWPKYIGKEVKYRAKPIWKPLVIGIIIMIPFVLAIIYSK